MIGPKEKKERALGVRLNLKGERCASPKCAAVRKPYKPGMHGQKRSRFGSLSEFGTQLREKQKFKLSYGLDERNMRQVFEKAREFKGSTASKIVELLERRLDNVVFRLGFAPSRLSSRQLIVHGHIVVNRRCVRSPGFLVKAGDVINLKEGSEAKVFTVKRKEILKKHELPSWLELDRGKPEGKVAKLPENVTPPFDVNLLVESFSK